MVIHKRQTSDYKIAMDVLCGRWIHYKETSYTWNKVTCKDCLKVHNNDKKVSGD